MKKLILSMFVLMSLALTSCEKENGTGFGTGHFTINGSSYQGTARSVPAVTGKGVNVVIFDESKNVELVVYNVAAEGNSNLHPFSPGESQTTPYVIAMGDGNYSSITGKLTKAGNTIVFSGELKDILTDKEASFAGKATF